MDENELWIQLKKENKELSKTLDKLDKKTYKIQKEIISIEVSSENYFLWLKN